MDDRDQAIELISRAGFAANKRDWSMGSTVIAFAGPLSTTNAITAYAFAVCIYPEGMHWAVADMRPQHWEPDEFEAIDAAAQHAVSILQANLAEEGAPTKSMQADASASRR